MSGNIHVRGISVCAVCEFMHFFDEYLPSGYYVPGTVLGEGNNMLNWGEIS